MFEFVSQRGRLALLAVLAGIFLASPAGAQSIVDARRLEFTPSADHNTVDSNGAVVVTRYSLDVFLAGGQTPVSGADLGKPNPDPDGMIRVDFVALLSSPLTPGMIYEAVVEAVGPGGSSGGPRSNTFAFAAHCAAPSISPTSRSFTPHMVTTTSPIPVHAPRT